MVMVSCLFGTLGAVFRAVTNLIKALSTTVVPQPHHWATLVGLYWTVSETSISGKDRLRLDMLYAFSISCFFLLPFICHF